MSTNGAHGKAARARERATGKVRRGSGGALRGFSVAPRRGAVRGLQAQRSCVCSATGHQDYEHGAERGSFARDCAHPMRGAARRRAPAVGAWLRTRRYGAAALRHRRMEEPGSRRALVGVHVAQHKGAARHRRELQHMRARSCAPTPPGHARLSARVPADRQCAGGLMRAERCPTCCHNRSPRQLGIQKQPLSSVRSTRAVGARVRPRGACMNTAEGLAALVVARHFGLRRAAEPGRLVAAPSARPSPPTPSRAGRARAAWRTRPAHCPWSRPSRARWAAA